MKSRTMIYLEESQLRALKREANTRRISLAELFRRLVEEHLSESRPSADVPREKYLAIVGLGSSGQDNVSKNHDEHLSEILYREHRG